MQPHQVGTTHTLNDEMRHQVEAHERWMIFLLKIYSVKIAAEISVMESLSDYFNGDNEICKIDRKSRNRNRNGHGNGYPQVLTIPCEWLSVT